MSEAAAVEVVEAQLAPQAGTAAGLVLVALAEGQEGPRVPLHPPHDEVDLLVGRRGRGKAQGLQAAPVLPDGLPSVLLGQRRATRV